MISPPFPRNVPLKKGRLLVTPAQGSAYAIAFQYNPNQVSRTIDPRYIDPEDPFRSRGAFFQGAASETLSLEAKLEQLVPPDAGHAANGIIPQIAALQLLLFPPSADVVAEDAALDRGARLIVRSPVPDVILEWGQRSVPVRLTQLRVVEELFDAALNPVVATLTLSLRVLTYSTSSRGSAAYKRFLGYQMQMETLAKPTYVDE